MALNAPNQDFLNDFKSELKHRDIKLIAYDHILSGGSSILKRENFLKLRTTVADKWDHWGVHPNDIIMVGSGKLGFSLNPRHCYSLFHAESDFDLAILSERLFDHYWVKVHRYTQINREWTGRKRFFDYLNKGWIRPDLLPTSNFEDRGEWMRYFGSISNRTDFGRKKIAGAIYKSWDFLEAYHLSNLETCKSELENGNA